MVIGVGNIALESMINTEYVLNTMEIIFMMLKLWIIIREEAAMENYIETPKMSEILSEEFMIPFGLSAYKLAQEIHVPVSRIQDILHDRRKITADTSIRLGKFFGVSDRYFLDMQDDIDIRNTKMQIMEEINSISTFNYAQMG